MASGISEQEIRALAREVLRERFENVEIHDIYITRDVDEDGDPILRVKIIFDAENKILDSRRASSFARHMISRLAEAGEHAFPVVSYIAKSDLRKSKAATPA